MLHERLNVVRAVDTKSTSPMQAPGKIPGIIGWFKLRLLPHWETY